MEYRFRSDYSAGRSLRKAGTALSTALALWLSLGGTPTGAAEASVRSFVGSVGGYPIVMRLERHGAHVSGTYRYTRRGITLRLEGTLDGGMARLQEIFGNGARTAIITAHTTNDGGLEGVWTKLGGTERLRFRADPVSADPLVDAGSTAARQRAQRRATTAPKSTGAAVRTPALAAHRTTPRPQAARASRPAPRPAHPTATGTDAAFLQAVRRGDLSRARALLDRNADPD